MPDRMQSHTSANKIILDITMIVLQDIATARSGDKGSNSNIGVIANTFNGYLLLKKILTEKAVEDYFSDLHLTSVVRYELPNLWALNFVLYGALGEGGSRSLRLDAQGKALGQKLLQMPLPLNETDILEMQQQINEDSS